MAISYDLANPNNWEERYSNSVQAEPAIVPGNFKPIPRQVFPFLFNSPIIAIQAQSSSAKSTWKTAGYVYQLAQTGISIESAPDSLAQQRNRIHLNEINLLFLRNFGTSYGLVMDIPYWLKQISYFVYEYTGSIVDTVDLKLDEIRAAIGVTNTASTASTDGLLGNELRTSTQTVSLLYLSDLL